MAFPTNPNIGDFYTTSIGAIYQFQSPNVWKNVSVNSDVTGLVYQNISFSVDSNSTTAAHVTFTGEIEVDGTSEVKDGNISSVEWYYRDATTSGVFVKAGTSGLLSELQTYITDNITATDDISIRPLAIFSGTGLGSVGFDYKILYK